jgi:hypothetical protein
VPAGGYDFLNRDEANIAQLMLGAGYKTAHFGKWHNGQVRWGNAPRRRGAAVGPVGIAQQCNMSSALAAAVLLAVTQAPDGPRLCVCRCWAMSHGMWASNSPGCLRLIFTLTTA